MLGAIIGDVVGSSYEFQNTNDYDFKLFTKESSFTDDTVLTIAMMDYYIHKYEDGGNPAQYLKKWGLSYPYAGYGARFAHWLFSKRIEPPYNSFGNGSAMRVSAAGYATTIEEVETLSNAMTEVTHNHPEGMKGALVVAKCIYYARHNKSKDFIKEFLENEYPEIKHFQYKNLQTLKHGPETCQASVPHALYCFLISNDFEDCLRKTVAMGGDADTTAAISCSVAEAFYKNIPQYIIDETLKRLPEKIKDIIKKFDDTVTKEQ